ncbi:hypothetical protein SVAN01_02161 [Stagonosporopsis vannaccii]|nr:hypothetical protein SVAN01_02161 [Stagonosporopsis vannaccii]
MLSFNAFMLFLIVAALLKNETLFKLVLQVLVYSLSIIHSLLTIICYVGANIITKNVNTASKDCNAVHPAKQVGAVKLTNSTAWLVRHARCGWCAAVMWIVDRAEFVPKWLAGGTAQKLGLVEDWVAISGVGIMYCANAGACARGEVV